MFSSELLTSFCDHDDDALRDSFSGARVSGRHPDARRARRGGRCDRVAGRSRGHAMAAVHARVSPLILECVLLDVDAVTPGNDFSIRVRARTGGGPVRVRAIDVAWHGVQRLDPAWVPPTPTSASNAGLAPGERYIARSPAGAVAEGVLVHPGEIVERCVGVRLPPGLPPTYRGAVARTSYFITCVATTSDAGEGAPDPPKTWERAHARVPLKVLAPENPFETLVWDAPTDGAPASSEEASAGRAHISRGEVAPPSSRFWMHELASAAMGRATRAEDSRNDSGRSFLTRRTNSATRGNLEGDREGDEVGRSGGSPPSPFPRVPRPFPERTVARGFVIAMRDEGSDGKIRLARLAPSRPFPRVVPGGSVSGLVDFQSAVAGSEERESDATNDDDDDDDARLDANANADESVFAYRLSVRRRAVRFSASLESRETVAAAADGFRRSPSESAGRNFGSIVSDGRGETNEDGVLVRRKIWCEFSKDVADVSACEFVLSAPLESPPSFRSARVKLEWTVRFEFTVATPAFCRGKSVNSGGFEEDAGGNRARGGVAKTVEWIVPVFMSSPAPGVAGPFASAEDGPAGKASDRFRGGRGLEKRLEPPCGFGGLAEGDAGDSDAGARGMIRESSS